MGVPHFFQWLLKNFKHKILLKKLPQKCDYFYSDTNCLLHPECNKINEYYTDISGEKLEKKMFKRITNYLIYLENIVNPSKVSMTSIDGVAPLAKMAQQRKRRFKAVIDTKIRNQIKKKYGKHINDKWNNTVITPSTEFMEKLHIELLNHFKTRKNNLKSKLKYVYSSYHSCGEGEAKILQHIKKNVSVDDVCVIYGLDADLIFLSIASRHNNIYLLREATHFGNKKEEKELHDPVTDVEQDLIFVSISETKNAFNNQLLHLVVRSCYLF